MNLRRPEIAALEQNAITGVALSRIGDPDVLALRFGEGDHVTDGFIRDAAKQELDDGETLHAHTRRIVRYIERHGNEFESHRILKAKRMENCDDD